eukprot:337789-Alexandrium_andersonii.AAC.1
MSKLPIREWTRAALSGLTGIASSGPPGGGNPAQLHCPYARASAAAESAAPCPRSAPLAGLAVKHRLGRRASAPAGRHQDTQH